MKRQFFRDKGIKHDFGDMGTGTFFLQERAKHNNGIKAIKFTDNWGRRNNNGTYKNSDELIKRTAIEKLEMFFNNENLTKSITITL